MKKILSIILLCSLMAGSASAVTYRQERAEYQRRLEAKQRAAEEGTKPKEKEVIPSAHNKFKARINREQRMTISFVKTTLSDYKESLPTEASFWKIVEDLLFAIKQGKNPFQKGWLAFRNRFQEKTMKRPVSDFLAEVWKNALTNLIKTTNSELRKNRKQMLLDLYTLGEQRTYESDDTEHTKISRRLKGNIKAIKAA